MPQRLVKKQRDEIELTTEKAIDAIDASLRSLDSKFSRTERTF